MSGTTPIQSKLMKRLGSAAALVVCLLVAGCAAFPNPDPTGFSKPFSGPAQYEFLAPVQASDPSQLNVPIGIERADQIAFFLGLRKDRVLTDQQFRQFISGGGNNGSPEGAALADRSVQIFTNTIGRPLTSDVDGVPTQTVLASYGLFVNKDGLLMSLANQVAPTRIANLLLSPAAACPEQPLCAYINRWFLTNGAADSLLQLYQSAYTVEALFGYEAQQTSGVWQLVANTKSGTTEQVGMSMAPALWLTNFILLYTLKPAIAAQMPAYWSPIPQPVADAILATTDTGYVQWNDFESFFPAQGQP